MINGGQISAPSGVTSLNLLTGALALIAGTNISITPMGDTILIDTADYLSGITSNVQDQINAISSGRSVRGFWDASVNLFPATGGSGPAGAILAGDQWSISVTGTLDGKTAIVGTFIVALFDSPGQTGANWNVPQDLVTSVFGRMGAIIPVAGDYDVSLITGAAPIANPAFTGTPTAPTPLGTDSSTAIATTAAILNKVLTGLSFIAGQKVSNIDVANTILSAFNNYASSAPAAYVANDSSSSITIELNEIHTILTTNTRTAILPLSTSVQQYAIYSVMLNPVGMGSTPTGLVAVQSGDTLEGIVNGTYSLTGPNRFVLFRARAAGLGWQIIASSGAVSQGGTGINSYTTGDIIYASGPGVLSKLAAVGVGSVYASNGVGAPPILTNAPAFGGNPTAPTPTAGDNTLKLATTEFVNNEITALLPQQHSFTNTGLTISTDILIAVAPLSNAIGYYILTILDTVSSNELTILYQLSINQYNFGLPLKIYVSTVNDSANVITANNLSNYLTFFAYQRTSSNPYIAVTVRMTGGLLYSATTLKYTCTQYSESFLGDNSAITTFIAQPLSNLGAPALSTILNGVTPALGNYPASSVYMYTANSGANNVSMFKINTLTGVPSALSPSTIITSTTPTYMVGTPNGKFIYVSNSGTNLIGSYTTTMDTGQLSGPGSNSVTTPGGLVMHPNGKFLFATSSGTSIAGYSINQSNAVLTVVNSISGGSALQEAAINPAGTYLYIVDSTGVNVRQFIVNTTTGNLTANGTTSAILNAPQNVTVHPNGNFVYAVNSGNATIQLFTITQSTGVLVAGSTTATGSTPRGLCFTPNGLFAYVVNSVGSPGTVQCYSVNLSTGVLTVLAVPTYNVGTTPTRIRVSNDGRFLYITNSGSANISQFQIATDGSLTSLGSAVAASTSVNGIWIV